GQFNLYHHNDAINESIDTILLSQADVVTIQELNSRWSEKLKKELKSSHPFVIEETWDNCCYGIGLYSKFPITSHEIVHFDSIPAIEAILDVRGKAVTVISLHTQAPAFPNKTPVRNAQLNLISEIINKNEKPCVLVGDFNIVPWDGFFKQFLKRTAMKRVRIGLQPTYPMDLGIPLIPIDHILYSKEFEPTSCETVNIPGSDHKGLIAGFRFN
ncbi:MAG: endonuclease/exonuclease/phosphatase family protein, partial [Flavobacteriales bacterium]|nr:endonuclease/exonuclease/phosphatase family protein [Flavobacteriales bacterium]